jgi:hypothetical protein
MAACFSEAGPVGTVVAVMAVVVVDGRQAPLQRAHLVGGAECGDVDGDGGRIGRIGDKALRGTPGLEVIPVGAEGAGGVGAGTLMAASLSASRIATTSLSLMTTGVIGEAGREAGTSSVVVGVSEVANTSPV